MENNLIKSVFCSYRGILIVHDIKGNRVDHLCGELTLEKHEEIEKLTADITEFDGLDHYKRIVSEKQEKLEIEIQGQQPPVVMSPPQGLPQPQQSGQVFQIEVENTTDKQLPVVLFGAYVYGTNNPAVNFGNHQGIKISDPKSYANMLAQSMNQTLNLKSISFTNINSVDGMDIVNTSATGLQTIHRNEIKNWFTAYNQTPNVQINQNFVISGQTEIRFKLNANSKTFISLTT